MSKEGVRAPAQHLTGAAEDGQEKCRRQMRGKERMVEGKDDVIKPGEEREMKGSRKVKMRDVS